MIYIPYTVTVMKDGVCLFETDCELCVIYDLPDGRHGLIDWDVTEFHFSDNGNYTKICRPEPLFGVLYASLDQELVGQRVRETLANDDVVSLYGEA